MEFERTSDRSKTTNSSTTRPPDFIRGDSVPGLSTSNENRVGGFDPRFTSPVTPSSMDDSWKDSRRSMVLGTTDVQKACILLGGVMVLAGFIGFGIPAFFGLHLSPAHNFIHLIAGAASLYVGLKGTPRVATSVAFALGAFFGVFALTGFLFGSPDTFAMPMFSGYDRLLLPVSRGSFELGVSDHVLHALLAVAFLIPAFKDKSFRVTR